MMMTGLIGYKWLTPHVVCGSTAVSACRSYLDSHTSPYICVAVIVQSCLHDNSNTEVYRADARD